MENDLQRMVFERTPLLQFNELASKVEKNEEKYMNIVKRLAQAEETILHMNESTVYDGSDDDITQSEHSKFR